MLAHVNIIIIKITFHFGQNRCHDVVLCPRERYFKHVPCLMSLPAMLQYEVYICEGVWPEMRVKLHFCKWRRARKDHRRYNSSKKIYLQYKASEDLLKIEHTKHFDVHILNSLLCAPHCSSTVAPRAGCALLVCSSDCFQWHNFPDVCGSTEFCPDQPSLITLAHAFSTVSELLFYTVL